MQFRDPLLQCINRSGIVDDVVGRRQACRSPDRIAVQIVIESDHLLAAVVEFSKAMGMVFNPKFFFSLEDWYLDHAADVFSGIEDLF